MFLLLAMGCGTATPNDTGPPCRFGGSECPTWDSGASAWNQPDFVAFDYAHDMNHDDGFYVTGFQPLGDWTGDGAPELLVQSLGTAGVADVVDGGALAQARYEETASVSIGTVDDILDVVRRLGDARGDGIDALVVVTLALPSEDSRVYFCAADASWQRVGDCDAYPAPAYGRAIDAAAPAGDQDGDGRTDLVLGTYEWNGSTSDAWLLPGVPGAEAALEDAVVARLTTSLVADPLDGTDVDGDGVADVLVTGDRGSVLFLGPIREDRTQDEADAFFGGMVRADLSADLDGDGHPDAAYQRRDDVHVLSLATAAEEPFATIPDASSPFAGGDVDGDGFADLLAFRPVLGEGTCLWSGPLAGTLGEEDASRCFGEWGIAHAILPDLQGDGFGEVLATQCAWADDWVDLCEVGFWAGGP